MKMLSTLFCVLLASQSVVAQIRHAVQPGFNSFGGEMQLMHDGTIRMLGIAAEDYGYGTAFVSTVYLSKTGEVISTTMHQELSYEVALEIQSLPMHDGSTIVIASFSGCDYGIPVSLGRINAEGSVAWSMRPKESEIYGHDAYGQQVTDTIFQVTDGLHESYFSANGKIVEEPVGFVLFDYVSLTTKGFIASQYTQFAVLDSAFSINRFIILPAEVTAFDTIQNDGFLVATTDSIYVLNAALDIIKVEVLPSSNAHFVFSTSQNYWTVDKAINRFYKLTPTLGVQESYPLDETISIKDVMTIGDSIFVSGNFFHINKSIAFLQTTADAFSLDLPADAGVVKMRLTEQAISESLEWAWFGFPLVSVDYGPVFVTVKNFGMTTIDDVYIRFQDDACPTFCGGLLQYQWHLTGLNLLPGQSTERSIGELILDCTLYDISTICMYTLHPNDEPDIKSDNNSHCIQVDVISSLSDHIETGQWRFYPNPVTDLLYIESPEGIDHDSTEITLFNSHGQCVMRAHLSANTQSINLENTLPGVYFLLVQRNAEQPFMKKIIVL